MTTKVGDLLVELVVQAAKGNAQAVKAATDSFKNISGAAEKSTTAVQRASRRSAASLRQNIGNASKSSAVAFTNLSKQAGISLGKLGKSSSTTGITRMFSRIQSGASRAASSMSKSFGAAQTQLGAFSKRMSKAGSGITKGITAPILGAATAVATLTGALGFKRLVAIDTARGQFRGLGYDADQVMKQVDAGVTNTSLSMAEGAALAVGILATGGVEMDQLADQIKRVSNISAAYNLDAAQAGYLLNNILTKQKVTWGDLSQMQMNQIPIISQLRDHYGVTAEELEKMVQDGKVSIEDLNEVIDKNAGKAAEEYAKTWAGVTANIRSNIGKIGAAFLEGAFEQAKGGATALLEVLRSPDLADAARGAGKAFSNFIDDTVDRIKSFKEAWDGLSDPIKNLIITGGTLLVTFGPLLNLLSLVGKLAAGGAGGMKLLSGAFGLIARHPIVAAISAAVGALTWFFTQTETGKGIVAAAWEWIQGAIAAVVDWWTGTAAPAFGAAWEWIKGVAQGVADWWNGTLMPILRDGWDTVTDAAGRFGDWFMQHVYPIFESLGELGKALWNRLQPVFAAIGGSFRMMGDALKWVWDTILAPVFGWIGERFAAAWEQAKAAWDVIGPPLMAALSVAWENFKLILGAVWDWIVLAVETGLANIKGIIDAVTAAINGDWEGAWEAVKGVWANLMTFLQETAEIGLTLLKDLWDNIWGLIGAKVTEIWNSITAFLSGVWNSITSTATGFGNGIRDFFTGIWNSIRDTATNVWNSIVDFITGIPGKIMSGLNKLGELGGKAAEWFGEFLQAARDKFTEAVEFARGIPGKILSALGNVGSKLVGAGRSLIGGFVNGIRAGFDNAVSAVKAGVERVRGFFPFSPAKEGPFSGQGYLTHSGENMMRDYAGSLSRYSDLPVRAGKEAQERLAAVLGAGSASGYSWSPAPAPARQTATYGVSGPSMGSPSPGTAQEVIHIGTLQIQMPENAEWADMQKIIRDVKRSKQEGYMMGMGASSGYSG